MAGREELQQVRNDLYSSFDSGITLPYKYRMEQLKKCAEMIKAMEKEYFDAVYQDMKKHPMAVNQTDLRLAESELGYAMKHLKSWMGDRYVKTDIVNTLDHTYVNPEPLGVSVIFGAWNYPLLLVMTPLVGAISAGCCAVVKPSEVSPATSTVIKKYFDLYLDPKCYRTIEGGVETATELLAMRWDHIFYTGSVSVGRIVARAAAEHLTPTVLELGGKSPTIVDETTNIDTAAKRVIWGKCVNAGQTCIAPDYVYVHKSQFKVFIERMEHHVKQMFGEDPETSDSFPRIINERHFQRLSKLISHGTVAFGGKTNKDTCYIAPTVVINPDMTSELMTDEIFGPILPVMEYEDINTVIRYIREREKPLVTYLFSNSSKTVDEVKKRVSTGTLDINDTLMHMCIPTLPFGGVGESGMGKYHGKATFEAFSHMKSVNHKPIGMEAVNSIRYPPYDADWKQKLMFQLAFYKPSSGPARSLSYAKYAVSSAMAGAGAAFAYAYGYNYLDSDLPPQ